MVRFFHLDHPVDLSLSEAESLLTFHSDHMDHVLFEKLLLTNPVLAQKLRPTVVKVQAYWAGRPVLSLPVLS